ncbi:uncharacterized protein LOC106370842 isoform X1 [Brassica napus]|uniref:uncharacterized protein LOC106370842 isoform X1 n=2 Tax=Brassica napus TaxID=3708 RepID=UPI0006AB195F|nr:uncharacterized protein LOC106370842 isoform X1 [Brassica napus]
MLWLVNNLSNYDHPNQNGFNPYFFLSIFSSTFALPQNLLPFLFYSDKLNPGLIKSSHQTSSPKVSQIGQREIEIGAILRWCISELQNRRLYIKQATSATSVTDKEEEEAEWVEYKIKETNMFTVDKYQQSADWIFPQGESLFIEARRSRRRWHWRRITKVWFIAFVMKHSISK